MPAFIFAFLLSLLVFLFLYFWERRSIFISLFFFNTFVWAGAFVLTTGVLFKNDFTKLLVFVLGVIVLICFLFGPTAFLLMLYINGFRILRREGVRFHNFLSLGLAVALTIYLFIAPSVTQNLSGISFFNFLFLYIGLLVSYGIVVSTLYTTSSFINLVNLFPGKLDYIVVLGAGLNGEKVTPLLASRINKGIALYKKHAGSKLIMSGGQGADEVISEAEAMRNYALEQGIAAEDIIMENQATNTEENLTYSYSLMKPNSRFALVTNYYHVFRALLLARKSGIKCIGYGAKTKFYFSLNAFIREFAGYLVMSRTKHFWILGLLSFLYVMILAISYLQQ